MKIDIKLTSKLLEKANPVSKSWRTRTKRRLRGNSQRRMRAETSQAMEKANLLE